MIVDYKAQRTYDATLQIDDPGNCAIMCHGSFRDNRVTLPGDYYMIVATVMGRTTIIKWGPLVPDISELPNGYTLDVKSFNYKEPTIEREITMFINSPDKAIYEAETILVEEALEAIPTIDNYKATID